MFSRLGVLPDKLFRLFASILFQQENAKHSKLYTSVHCGDVSSQGLYQIPLFHKINILIIIKQHKTNPSDIRTSNIRCII